MKYSIWAFLGIAAAIIITLLCVGCTEEKTITSDLPEVNVYWEPVDIANCKFQFTLSVPGEKPDRYNWRWGDWNWNNYAAIDGLITFPMAFPDGPGIYRLQAEAYKNSKLIAEFVDGLNIKCSLPTPTPGPKEIKLGGTICTDPNEPAAPIPCNCVTLIWSGGEPPYDILWGYDPDILFLMDSCDCHRYGAQTLSDPTYYQVEDASGAVSNVLRWDYPDDCQ